MADNDLRTVWPIAWSAVWVGALAALSVALIIGLVGISVGAHKVGVRLASARDLGFGALVFSVLGAFFSFVAGAWVANRLAGHRDAENAIVHGAIVWALTVPMLLFFTALGTGSYGGGWYGGLAGSPAWASVPADPNAAVAARNSALGAVTALLIGLAGSVIGGWMASGQPMRLWSRYEQTANKPRRSNI